MGGFSICSSPRELKETNTIELAVKHSQHPPALWVHTKVCVYNLSIFMYLAHIVRDFFPLRKIRITYSSCAGDKGQLRVNNARKCLEI